MKQDNFEYEVAFSFAQKDETIAYSIYKLLKDRVKCFIYSEEHKKLAGTDGEITFNKVFSQESRIVVIFQSIDWGNTKWTKIEETAIRNRGFENGYDFVILIPTEKLTIPPICFPKNRLWIGLERWGIDGAAVAIEARIQEFGGQVKELTVVEKLLQTDTELKHKRKVEQILSSTEGLEMATAEFQNLLQEFEVMAKEIKSSLSDWHLRIFKNITNGINLWSYDYCLTIQWYPKQTAERTNVLIILSDGLFDENLYKTDFSYNYQIRLKERKQFDINEFNQKGWSTADTRKKFLTTKQAVDHYLNIFFDAVKTHRFKKNKY